jgi:predicted small lipoprotein YifL
MKSVLLLMFLLLSVTACGKKGPLIYPEMLVPAAPSDFRVQQSGTALRLSLGLPSKDLAGRNLSGLSGLSIYKRVERGSATQSCGSCPSDFTLFRKLNLDLLPAEVQRFGNVLVAQDNDVRPGNVYSYRCVAVTKDNLEGAFSPQTVSSVVAAPPPPVLQVISHPTEIILEFVGVPPQGATIVGYFVYRTSTSGVESFQPLNREPIAGNRYVDSGLDRGTIYRYTVRTLLKLSTGMLLESSPSNVADGLLKDDE